MPATHNPYATTHADLCARRDQPLSVDEWMRYLPGITPFYPCHGG